MEKNQLRLCLDREVERWRGKPYETLASELASSVNYECGEGRSAYQTEVILLEDTPEYVHVMVGVSDGGWRSFVPLTTTFLVYRDGRPSS
jgi:hypothetical protein